VPYVDLGFWIKLAQRSCSFLSFLKRSYSEDEVGKLEGQQESATFQANPGVTTRYDGSLLGD
jgi:hypothetical protein